MVLIGVEGHFVTHKTGSNIFKTQTCPDQNPKLHLEKHVHGELLKT